MIIRPETAADIDDIRAVTERAFATAQHSDGTEPAIIDGLRAQGRLTLSLVAQANDELIGHVAFSPVQIAGHDLGWVGLGPVSVDPDHQGRGTGHALISEGLKRVQAMGMKGCVVLGEPAYYSRFGFVADADLWFAQVPPEYFMRLGFEGEPPLGEVSYAPPFYGK